MPIYFGIWVQIVRTLWYVVFWEWIMLQTEKKSKRGDAGQHYTRKQVVILLTLLWVGLLAFHATKALNLYPLVIPDEYTYTSDSRLRPFADDIIPNYLFYSIVKVTGLFGDRYFDAARVLNAFLFMLSAPFIFQIARMVCNVKLSLFLMFMVLISPYSSYTMYFMPESVFFTVFWMFIWLFFKYEHLRPRLRGIYVGAAIGVLCLLKVHGVFLLGGYALFCLVDRRGREWRAHFRDACLNIAAAVVSFAIVRLGVGYLYAGANGFRIFGSGYGDLLADSTKAIGLLSLARMCLYNLFGHLMAMCLLFALPIIVMGIVIFRRDGGNNPDLERLKRMSMLGLTLLVPLVVVSVGFYGTMQLFMPDEYPPLYQQVHMRYYTFLFPFFILVLGGAGAILSGSVFSRRSFMFYPILGIVAYTLFLRFSGYYLDAIPGAPEIGGLIDSPLFFYSVFGMALVACMLFLFRRGTAWQVWMYVYLPTHALVSIVLILSQAYANFGVYPDIYDKAGIFAREYLGKECSDLTIVDTFYNNAKKSLIHIDNVNTDILTQFAERVDVAQIRPGTKWLLLIGNFTIPREMKKFSLTYVDPAQTEELTRYMRDKGNFRFVLRYELVRIADYGFSADLQPGDALWPLERVDGKIGDVSFRYRIPLPRRFFLALRPTRSGTSPSGKFEVIVGGNGAPRSFALGEEISVVTDGKAVEIALRALNGADMTEVEGIIITEGGESSGAP